VPDEFFRPQPSLLAKRQNQFENVCVTLAVDGFFLDVEDEGAGRFQDAQKFGRTREEPVDLIVGADPAVCFLAAVGIRRRGYDQIKKVIIVRLQDVETISVVNFRLNLSHGNSL